LPVDNLNRKLVHFVAIDATPFGGKKKKLYEFNKNNILRELGKAIVGFEGS